MGRLALLAVMVALALPGTGAAAPYLPKDDSEVLERLPLRPMDPAARELGRLRQELAQDPSNPARAVAVARAYYRLALQEGDPRYVGYAQAALGSWWRAPAPPVEALVMRATLKQYLHDFTGGLGDLDQALEREPANGAARFQRALIHIIRADYPAARRDCEGVQGISTDLMARACVATVDGYTGHAGSSYERLRAALEASQPTPTEALWVQTRLGEMAYRLGRAEEADRHFRAALGLGIPDNYLYAVYAELLLDENRPREAVALLSGKERSDVLLVRLALAEKALGLPQAREHEAAIRARFHAARLREDKLHLQDEARFALHFERRPAEALALARENYLTQREPSDARMLMEAALAAGDPGAAHPALEWLAASGHEDVYIHRIAERLRSLPR